MYTTLEIHEWIHEWAAFAYFRWAFNRWSIQFYRQRNGMFQFKIDLPLIHITNTMYRRMVSTGTNPMYRTIAQTSGYVLWWKIKISEHQ